MYEIPKTSLPSSVPPLPTALCIRPVRHEGSANRTQSKEAEQAQGELGGRHLIVAFDFDLKGREEQRLADPALCKNAYSGREVIDVMISIVYLKQQVGSPFTSCLWVNSGWIFTSFFASFSSGS